MTQSCFAMEIRGSERLILGNEDNLGDERKRASTDKP